MKQENILELAKQGDVASIASLINNQLKVKNITAKVTLKDACLQVLLESTQVLNQKFLVAFIQKGITDLGAVSIRKIKVYAVQIGEEFPAWSQEIDLSVRSNLKTNIYQQESNTLNLNISINGTTITLNELEKSLRKIFGKILGILGSIILSTGAFAPIISVPVKGNFNYVNNGTGDGVILIILAIISLVITLKEKFKLLWWTGIASLGVLTIGLINFYMTIADVETQSIQLEWGWVILIIGTGLILASAAIPERENLNRAGYVKYFLDLFSLKKSHKSYLFLVLVLVGLIMPKVFTESRKSRELAELQQSEAKHYISTINSSQQIFYLESSKFARNLEELKLGIPSVTSDYKYEVVNSDSSQTIATATAKVDNFKSYIGAVFVTKDTDGSNTTIVEVCESNTPSKTPPTTPQLVGDKIECSNDSSKR